MSRVYSVLLAIECDFCERRTVPGDIEGWMKSGHDRGPGTEKFESYYCPDCSWRCPARVASGEVAPRHVQ